MPYHWPIGVSLLSDQSALNEAFWTAIDQLADGSSSAPQSLTPAPNPFVANPADISAAEAAVADCKAFLSTEWKSDVMTPVTIQ